MEKQCYIKQKERRYQASNKNPTDMNQAETSLATSKGSTLSIRGMITW